MQTRGGELKEGDRGDDPATSKVVLILGCFTAERKAILDAIREELRQCNYSPVLFDLQVPDGRDRTEIILALAHMSRFVIADITDARSIEHELAVIVPDLSPVPIQLLLLASQEESGMFEQIRRHSDVLEPVVYWDVAELLGSLHQKVIAPAEAKVREQRQPQRGPTQFRA